MHDAHQRHYQRTLLCFRQFLISGSKEVCRGLFRCLSKEHQLIGQSCRYVIGCTFGISDICCCMSIVHNGCHGTSSIRFWSFRLFRTSVPRCGYLKLNLKYGCLVLAPLTEYEDWFQVFYRVLALMEIGAASNAASTQVSALLNVYLSNDLVDCMTL